MLLLCCVCCADTVSTASLLHGLYDLGTLPILSDSRCRQFSSYDRTMGNGDRGNYLQVNGNRVVLADMKGPGAVVRIWSTNPNGVLKIFLDGNSQPVIDMPFDDFFLDKTLQPLRTQSSGGWISYYPIPYAKACRIEVENSESFYYHVDYQTYPVDTKVETYTNKLTPEASKELANLLDVWQNAGNYHATSDTDALGESLAAKLTAKSYDIAAGVRKITFEDTGAGCIDELILNLGSMTPLELRRTVLRIYWDGMKSASVEAPVSDLFGCGFGSTSFATLPVGMRNGTYYLRFPMPYDKSARIEIENGNDKTISCKLGVRHREIEKLGEGVGRFCAKYHHEITKQGQPYTILQGIGRGKFCGVNMTMQGDSRGLWLLEGDEIIYVDHENDFSFYGTGTEDYFNSGWYFSTGLVSQPLHALTEKDAGNAQISANRFQIPDCVPFDKQISVRIEHGGTCDYPTADYSSVAYFYQTLPHNDFFRMPRASEFGVPRRAVSYEADEISLDQISKSASAENGKLQTGDWAKLSDSFLGPCLVFVPDSENSSISFKFHVDRLDRYSVSAFMGGGEECGPVKVLVDGVQVGDVKDLYGKHGTNPTSRMDFGIVRLDAGEHTYAVQVAGENRAGKLPLVLVNGISVSTSRVAIKDWMIAGPFVGGIDAVSAPEQSKYDPKAVFTSVNDKQVGWTRVKGKDTVNLIRECAKMDNVTAYALTYVISPDTRTEKLLIGADDGVKVFLNGKEVYKHDVKRGITPDEDEMDLQLNEGANELLIKVTQIDGAWAYTARFLDLDSELRYMIEP